MGFFVFTVTNLILTLFASVITAFVAPAAAGSGIPEVKAYLNGVDAPEIFSLRTLLVKVKHSFLNVLVNYAITNYVKYSLRFKIHEMWYNY